MRVRKGAVIEEHGPMRNWMLHDPADEMARERKSANARSGNLRWKYGITEDEFVMLEQAQGGVCAICGELERVQRRGRVRRLSVDHDHDSGRVRGLLCHSCNAVLGMLRDDPERIARYARGAIAYLEAARLRSEAAIISSDTCT